ELQLANAIRADHPAGRPEQLAPPVPQPAKLTADGAGRTVPVARRLRVAGQQRRHRPAALLPNDRRTLRPSAGRTGEAESEAATGRTGPQPVARRTGEVRFCREKRRPAAGCDPQGGWGGIRTHGGVSPTAVFKTAALNRSATHPVCRAESAP